MNRTLPQQHSMLRTALVLLSCAIMCCMIVYGMMVFTIVHRVAARQKAQTAISETTLRISTLETQYLAAKNTITNEVINHEGFAKAVKTHFITNRSLGFSSRSIE